MNRRAVVLVGVALAGVAVAPHPVRAQDGVFDAVQRQRVGTIRLDGPIEAVYGLFEPSRRDQWEGRPWSYRALAPPSGAATAGAVSLQVITAPVSGHTAGEVVATWVVTDAEPPGRLKVIGFYPATEVWEIDVRLEPDTAGGTVATVHQRITALSPETNSAVERFFAAFDAMMTRWEDAINAVLQAGRAPAREHGH